MIVSRQDGDASTVVRREAFGTKSTRPCGPPAWPAVQDTHSQSSPVLAWGGGGELTKTDYVHRRKKKIQVSEEPPSIGEGWWGEKRERERELVS